MLVILTWLLLNLILLLTKITVAQNEVALSYHRVRGLYFLVVVFAATIYLLLACIYNSRASEISKILSPKYVFWWATSVIF